MTAVDPGWVRPDPGWTCPECGFDYDACVPAGVAARLRVLAGRFRIPLTRGLAGEHLDDLVRVRPPSGGWSALEYACHVRDAFGVYDYRIAKVLAEDRPPFPRMDRDRVVSERNYNGQPLAAVVEELAAAAESLARRLDAVPATGWQRVGTRDDFEMTVDWMARNAVHEGQHHLVDVARALRTARGR